MTYRQIACLWERYWERKVWDIETNVITNPMASFAGEGNPAGEGTPGGMIDATTDAGIAQMQAAGLPVKVTRMD